MANGDRQLTGVMRRLRAIREFSAEPISDDDLAEILGVARWTGSAQNLQPWRFVVVQSRETLDALAALAPNAPQLGRAPMLIAVVMPGQRAVVEAYDEARVTERILLAATALGLGASVGWIPQEARGEAGKVLGVPEDRLVRSVIAIGHRPAGAGRSRTRPGTARLPLEELVHVERWGRRG